MKIVKVGRAPENDIIIHDSLVSANHLAFTQDDEGNIFVQDFMSTNGTFVNGQKIDNQPIGIKSGDKIKIGQSELDWESYFIERKSIDEKPQTTDKTPQSIEFEPISQNPTKLIENQQFDTKNNRILLIGVLALALLFIIFLMIWYFNNIVKPKIGFYNIDYPPIVGQAQLFTNIYFTHQL